jgi:AcrR family transcriptional regulator
VKLDQPTLLAAAQRVFVQAGLEGASMRAIAREAGCDASLLYYYFKNKEDMFSALLEQRMPSMVAGVRKLANPNDPRSTAEKLWEIIQIFHTHAKDGGFRSMVRGQIAKGSENVSELVARKLIPAQVAMRAILRRGQRRGEIRPELSTILMLMFLLRMESEILDLVPVYAMRIGGMDGETALSLAERTWFDVYWRGVATDPLAPLSFLPPLPDLQPRGLK